MIGWHRTALFTVTVILAVAGAACSSARAMMVYAPAPTETASTGPLLIGGDPALATLLEPRLRAAGLAVTSESAGHSPDAGQAVVSLSSLQTSAQTRRVLHEQTVNDGGPRRLMREFHHLPITTATITVSGPRPHTVERHAIAHPAPDQRRDHGQWLWQEQPLIVVRGKASAVEEAALDAAVAAFAAWWQGDEQPRGRGVPLDTRDRRLSAYLDLAASGDHGQALSALKAQASADGFALSGPLAYNIGALYDVLDQQQAALTWYGRALAIEPRDLYRQRWEAVRQRAQAANAESAPAQQAEQGQPTPALQPPAASDDGWL